ncbi:putative multidrug resistance protein EmrY [compost metagenome]
MESQAASANQEKEQFKVVPILLSFMLAAFIGTFNETALNVALTTLMNAFSVTESTIQWLTTGYLLTQGILVPLSALLIQWFSTRKLFLTSVMFSILGALIAALAGSFEVLMVGRIFQAVGTAMLLPLMFNTVLVIFPVEKRGTAMGLVTLVFTAAPAIGPTISGLLIAKLSWHWIFWISFIFLILALVCGLNFMQNVSKITKPRIDLFSMLMSTIGFGGIVFGLSKAGESDLNWGSPVVLISMIVGIVALGLFVIRQLSMEKPLINLKAFTFPMFVVGTFMVFFCKMIIITSMLILPMYLIRVMRADTLSVGLILLPGGLVFALLSPVVGRLFDKWGPKRLVICGITLATVVLWFFTGITTTSSIALIIVLHCLLMIGVVMVWMPAQTNGLNQLPPALYPDGTAINNTFLQIAGAIGMAMAVSFMTSGQAKFIQLSGTAKELVDPAQSLNAGIQSAFAFALTTAIIGLVIGIFIKRTPLKTQNKG